MNMKKYLRFYWFAKRFIAAPVLMAMPALTSVARADIFEPGDEVTVHVSVLNEHYRHSSEHLRYSPLLGVEMA